MSRRERDRRVATAERGPDGRPRSAAPPPGIPEAPRPSLREQLASTVAARALLPIRFFFGITFLYAGVDKLLDPTFLDGVSPTSLAAQLADFARVSPLAPLVKVGESFATPLGLLIAFLEIAIGLGALTGLAYRVAAVGGFALSILFWLTASWATHPYYYGPDLPYAAGWLALALAGHGSLLVPERVLALSRPGELRGAGPAGRGARDGRNARGDGRTPRPAGGSPTVASDTVARRTLLQVGILGAATLLLGTAAAPLRALRAPGAEPGPGDAGSLGNPTPGPTAGGTTGPLGSRSPTSAAGSGAPVAKVADVKQAGAVAFTVPFDAPAPLPSGDPGVIVKLADGTFVAYDAVCTHEGCTVEWDARDSVLLCPCHGAAFDPAQRARVLQGPTRQPLASIPIHVDAATGMITLGA